MKENVAQISSFEMIIEKKNVEEKKWCRSYSHHIITFIKLGRSP